jgi:uncharacterized protein YjbI with pentapeptide repeats
MGNRSDRAYQWIDEMVNRLGRWLDANRQRIVIALTAASVSWYGQQMAEGTFLRSISPELFGIVITAVIIDYINERRQEAERKKVLIAQLGSKRRDITELALIEFRDRGWLYDGTLTKAELRDADLSGSRLDGAVLIGAKLYKGKLSEAKLSSANLSGADLEQSELDNAFMWGADLSKALLFRANLRESDMTGVNLSGSKLYKADLCNARLWAADLSDAAMRGANLSSADLWGANLKGTDLRDVNLSGATMFYSDLSGARNWNIEQLGQAASLNGATMPDGIQIEGDAFSPQKSIDGPTFMKWKDDYLDRHGGDESEIRDYFNWLDTFQPNKSQ